jgi:hypothetical protein
LPRRTLNSANSRARRLIYALAELLIAPAGDFSLDSPGRKECRIIRGDCCVNLNAKGSERFKISGRASG